MMIQNPMNSYGFEISTYFLPTVYTAQSKKSAHRCHVTFAVALLLAPGALGNPPCGWQPQQPLDLDVRGAVAALG